MDTFVYKAVALLTVTVLLFVSSHQAFGQSPTWRTTVADASVDVSDGTPEGLSSDDPIVNGANFAFGNAGHTLTITDNGDPGTITNLGNITTVSGGGGTLIFDLQNGGTNLTVVGDIGTDSKRVATVEVRISGGGLTVENVFAGTLANNGTLTASTIDVETLTNNGNLAITGGIVGILGGTGNITSTAPLTIRNTTSGGFGGDIDATDLTIVRGTFHGDITADNLTVNQGAFHGNIETTNDFTANLSGNLIIERLLTVGGNAEFTGNGRRADLAGGIETNGDFTVGNGTTVSLDIDKSDFGAGTGAYSVSGILEVYGDVGLSSPITVQTPNNGKVIDTSIFTNMVTTPSPGTAVIGSPISRSSAYMSDGFLAAMTIHQRYIAWNAVHDRLITGGRNDDGRSAWFNGIGRHSNHYRSSFNHQNWKTVIGGGQIGIDLFKTRHFQSGFLFGYEEGKSENDRDRLRSQDFYLGLYGACVFHNGADARIVFAQGWQNYKLNRRGNGNVLYTASFNGGTSEANFELGKRLGWGEWSLRPVLAADIFNNNLKAAQETGIGKEKVRYGKTDFTQVFFRTGTDLRHRTQYYTFNSGIYYAYDMNGAELKTHAWNVDNRLRNAPLIGTKLGDSLLMFNLGIEFEVFTNFSVSVGYLGEYAMGTANNALQSIGFVGFVGKW